MGGPPAPKSSTGGPAAVRGGRPRERPDLWLDGLPFSCGNVTEVRLSRSLARPVGRYSTPKRPRPSAHPRSRRRAASCLDLPQAERRSQSGPGDRGRQVSVAVTEGAAS